ncbi:MAG: TIGR04438 family Trp-rich protein [Burkholderiales bacterium]|jgi:small Trp-rich protein
MPLLWIGALLVALKWIGIEPVASWSWWWVVSPFLLAVIWWEWLERMLGLDRRAPDEARTGRSFTRKGR